MMMASPSSTSGSNAPPRIEGFFATLPSRKRRKALGAGLRIVCGFSFLQHIGKAAMTEMWFPADLRRDIVARLAAGEAGALDDLRVDWAAVRQFELMQETDNRKVKKLDVTNFKRATEYLMKMRAGGYRLTVVTLGRNVDPPDQDDLKILDQKLQEEITDIVHMLFLEDQSATLTKEQIVALKKGAWNYAEALPHVAMTLGAARLFAKRQKPDRTETMMNFFHLLELLPRRHIVHDVALGLALPEATAQKKRVMIQDAEFQYHAFQTALSTIFGMFDCVSLSALQERTATSSEIMPVMHHMRGHGDRLRPKSDELLRALARFVQNPKENLH
ncbi:MAG: hypothetical protein HGA90_03615 [Alphaproteobacteria bacterium]|nr:hypothetical protein [Alphaproteobacteria bacterium]